VDTHDEPGRANPRLDVDRHAVAIEVRQHPDVPRDPFDVEKDGEGRLRLLDRVFMRNPSEEEIPLQHAPFLRLSQTRAGPYFGKDPIDHRAVHGDPDDRRPRGTAGCSRWGVSRHQK